MRGKGMSKKEHARKTLMNYTKEELVAHCMTLEHNVKALEERFEVQYRNCVSLIADMNILNDTMPKSGK
jgi:hypothetical protein